MFHAAQSFSLILIVGGTGLILKLGSDSACGWNELLLELIKCSFHLFYALDVDLALIEHSND